MPYPPRKIINDPVYGFITLDHPLLLDIIAHPYYQRLRRIHQMAFAHLVYPGAVHTRLHHSLGAYHLMCNALAELQRKGVEITEAECLGAKIAILLHDIGHGPFSHALESVLIRNVSHETLSIRIMHALNREFGGQLDTAISIFTNRYPKHFLHQLVSGQLDVDRMDYLTRDSFFTGVSEGVIGYDRILKMLAVYNGELMVEEKGIYSIEKFLVARRLMYWQVYLHKTVLGAEKMLVRVLERARDLLARGVEINAVSPVLDLFLRGSLANGAAARLEPELSAGGSVHDGGTGAGMAAAKERAAVAADASGQEGFQADQLDKFCLLDDFDVMSTIKGWVFHPDKVLSTLCSGLIDRQLLKVKLQATPFEETFVADWKNKVAARMDISVEEAGYLVFAGQATNTTYDPGDEMINILFRDATVRDISKVDNALIQQTLSSPVKKFYICGLKFDN